MSSTPSSSSSTSSAFYFSSSSAEDVSSYRSQAATLRAEAAEARDKAQCLRSGSQKSLLLSLAVSKENRAQALVAAADVAEQEAREVGEAQRRREDRGEQPQRQYSGQRMRPVNDEEEDNRQLKRNSYSRIPPTSQDDVPGSSRDTPEEWTRTRRDGVEGGERHAYAQERQYDPSDHPSWEMHSSRSSRQGHEERNEQRPLCSPASSTSGRELRSPLESQRERPSYSREEEEQSSRENASSPGESQVR